MKFKILPGTKLYDTLWQVHMGMTAVSAAIRDTLKAKGFSGVFANSQSSSYLVNCDAIEILRGKPEGWKTIGEPWQKLYWPLAKNKEALKELQALPKIKIEAVNKPLNFSFSIGPHLEIYHRPGLYFHKKFILIDTANSTYKPVKEMIEIVESEFEKLKKKIK